MGSFGADAGGTLPDPKDVKWLQDQSAAFLFRGLLAGSGASGAGRALLQAVEVWGLEQCTNGTRNNFTFCFLFSICYAFS